MLHLVRQRVRAAVLPQPGQRGARRPPAAPSPIPRIPNVLTIGFARRFATYKRATLLFEELDWLREHRRRSRAAGALRLRGQGASGRRAGPGADPARARRWRAMPEFEGHVLFVEGYDLRLARAPRLGRRRVAQQPGLPARSVGHVGHEGGLQRRDQPVGARRLVGRGLPRRQRLGDQARVASCWTPSAATARRAARSTRSCRTRWSRSTTSAARSGFSPEWMQMAKRSMTTLLPRFSAARMVDEYVESFYRPAARQGARYLADGGERREDRRRMEGAGTRRVGRRTLASPRSAACERVCSANRSPSRWWCA